MAKNTKQMEEKNCWGLTSFLNSPEPRNYWTKNQYCLIASLPGPTLSESAIMCCKPLICF